MDNVFNDRIRKITQNHNLTDGEIETILNEKSLVYLPSADFFIGLSNIIKDFTGIDTVFATHNTENYSFLSQLNIDKNLQCYKILHSLQKSINAKFNTDSINITILKSDIDKLRLSPVQDAKIANDLLLPLQTYTADFAEKIQNNDVSMGMQVPSEFSIIPFTRKDTSAYAIYNKSQIQHLHQYLECIIAYKDRCEAVEISDYKAIREFYENDKNIKVVYITTNGYYNAIPAYRLIYPYIELAKKGLIKLIISAAIHNKETYVLSFLIDSNKFKENFDKPVNTLYVDWFENALIKPDIIVCQRYLSEGYFKLFNAIKSEMDRFHFTGPAIRFIHDNDDLLIDVPEYNTNAETYKKNKEKIIKQLEYFNEFTVSTDFLKSKTPIKSYDKITVIPNLINLDYYQPYAKSINDILPDFSKEFVVSYHGGSSHNGDIQCIEDVFTQIYKWNNIKFAFFGFVPQILRDINRDKIYYQPPINISYNRYPYVLSGEGKIRKDIALLPLVENDFNKAKSNLKLMEYSALGIPCICSDFDGCPFSDAPIKIPNNDTTAWIEEIKRLMNDTEYYKKQVELALLYAKKYDINGDKSKALKELILS